MIILYGRLATDTNDPNSYPNATNGNCYSSNSCVICNIRVALDIKFFFQLFIDLRVTHRLGRLFGSYRSLRHRTDRSALLIAAATAICFRTLHAFDGFQFRQTLGRYDKETQDIMGKLEGAIDSRERMYFAFI